MKKWDKRKERGLSGLCRRVMGPIGSCSCNDHIPRPGLPGTGAAVGGPICHAQPSSLTLWLLSKFFEEEKCWEVSKAIWPWLLQTSCRPWAEGNQESQEAALQIRWQTEGPQWACQPVNCPFVLQALQNTVLFHDCAISGGINIAGGLFKRLVTWNGGFWGFFPPFSFPFELSPRDRSAPNIVFFNSLAFSSNFLFLSRWHAGLANKREKDMR